MRLTLTDSLFSFAKFLELLLYSSALHHTNSPLCEHTSPPGPEDSLPTSRFNVIRHFSLQSCIISVSLSEVDVFEIQSPRLQILRSGERGSSDVVPPATESKTEANHDGERRVLRHEIKSFWEGVSDHLDKLVRLGEGV
jgi:1-phosphatidylinositol-3-phosphate 5-kinase